MDMIVFCSGNGKFWLQTAMEPALTDAQNTAYKKKKKNPVCSSAINAASNANVFLQGLMATRKFVPVTITGRPRGVVLNAHENAYFHVFFIGILQPNPSYLVVSV